MKYLILVLIGIAMYHFVYEGVIAPSIRVSLRNRLFVIRDELRSINIAGIKKCDEQAFWVVHEGINSYINRLPYLTLRGRAAAMTAYREDSELRSRVEKRVELLTACEDKRITDLLARASAVVEEAFIVNMGGTFIYIVPLAVLAMSLDGLRNLAKKLVLTPERDTLRVVPQQA